MKRSILLIACIAFVCTAMTQQLPNPYPKTITVSGSAEMEIVPDEIFVNIEVREYQKRGESKKDIETLKMQFFEACKSAGIHDSLVSIVSYSGYNDYYHWKRNKKRENDLQAAVTYQVKFKSSKSMDELVDKLDDESTNAFLIVNTSHTKMTEFRRQLKIQAIKAAKAKGLYLTEAIDEKLGEAITITEPGEGGISVNGFYMDNARISNNEYSQFNARYEAVRDATDEAAQEIDFKKIKLRFEVSVVFALK
jgi:uncharacterized protein YggE